MTFFPQTLLEVASRNSDAVAICDNGRKITYAQLVHRIAGVAQKLASQGAGPETPVALRIEKSADYVIAMLGCWHAGAAFVPLPPSLPAERQEFMIREASINHFLTAADTAAEADVPPANISPETPAYIIYTSGSTGKPKGVMVEHRGIMALCDAQRAAFAMKAGSRSLWYLSVNFDASVSDICVTLSSGATLVIPPVDALKDGTALLRVLKNEAITHLDIPPSLLKALNPEDTPDSLETIIIGGEAAALEDVRRWAKSRRVVNVYGPTEATVCTSLNICDENWSLPLVGTPLPGVEYTVINEELLIGGDCLARGYLNRPELMAEKFIRVDGKRLYRTGDRVRQHDDGAIEFLGRIDRQFKLRGQLVEPDEIEAALRAHPQVMKVAVLKREERLVAFIAVTNPAIVAELPAYLSKTLPGWMIPQHFEIISRLPLTAAGKTDYAALRDMPLKDAAERIAPRNETERRIFAIWQVVLKHGNFGVTDPFYAVGGDSLGIIRLTLESERQGLPLSAGYLVRHATIAEQAANLQQQGSALSAEKLRRDVAFTEADHEMFRRAAERPAAAGGSILLTGATGFLGSRVLQELLKRTKEDIYCIVRAPDEKTGLQRIADAVAKFDVKIENWRRVRVIPGDLSQPQGGLDAKTWDFLATNIGAIYHCAACVNMVLSYADMRAANTGAGLTLLKLACEGRRKAIHSASTLSVFVATNRNSGTLLESDLLDGVTDVYGGYAQSKFAAEYMLAQVPADAVPVAQYRFGLLTGNAKTGAAPAGDFLALFVKGLAQLGAVPEGQGKNLQVDITPVCYAAAAMVDISLKGGTGVYHLAGGGVPLKALVAALKRGGHDIRELPARRWLELVRSKPLTAEESSAALSLCRAFPDEKLFLRQRTMDLFQATGVTFDTRRADAALKGSGIHCPDADARLLDLYMSRFLTGPRPLKICLFGPESTGKSTMAERLAKHFGASFVAEYAKEHIAARDGHITADDIPLIAAGQLRAEADTKEQDLLFCDTDLLTTKIWSERLFGSCPGWIRDAAALQHYDLYLMMDIDAPWVADIHRYLPEERRSFLDLCCRTLKQHGRKYTMLSGSWEKKFATACAAVERLQARKQEKAA